MIHRPIPKKIKEVILSHIDNPDYRYVIQLILDGKSYDEIANLANYSVRQIQRIVPSCWCAVSLRLAEHIVNTKGRKHHD